MSETTPLHPIPILIITLYATVHSFLEPQPIHDASVFILRHILHNWADPYCKTILKHLRDAASPETKLVIVDPLIPYTCHGTSFLENIQGAELSENIPKELLPSLGRANNYAFQVDFQVSVHQNLFVLCT